MSSQAVYCLSLQIRQQEDNTDSGLISQNDGQSIGPEEMQSDSDSGELIKSIGGGQTQLIQHQQSQPSAIHQQNNLILVRGTRTENGHIILQNSQDLFKLLNGDHDKSILVQPRLKAKGQPDSGTIILQPTIKSATPDQTILVQSNSGIKNNSTVVSGTTSLPEGSIILQQQITKNGTTTDGPILLQTLKQLNKHQQILVIRNPGLTPATVQPASAKVSNQNLNVVNKLKTTTSTKGSDITDDKSAVTVRTTNASTKIQNNVPLGSDGEPIKLPENLESLPRADHFPTQRHRWNTNEEIAAILISFDKHSEWQSKEVRTRPKSGSMLLYSRKKVRYRRDGYCWKKRKDGKTTREDHMKLKVQGTECIYGCYVHSAILPTFHRRCYWLLQNPDIVLVHYLNVPYPDDNKMAVIAPSLALWGDKKEWTKDELVSQLKPMFFSEDDSDSQNELEISTAETVEAIVTQLMEKQRLARQAALIKQLECGCPDSTCADAKSCSHPMRRSNSLKSTNEKRTDNVVGSNNQVTSTTPNVLIGQRLYSRWNVDRRMGGREDIAAQKLTTDGNQTIHFQMMPTTSNHTSISNDTILSRSHSSNLSMNTNQQLLHPNTGNSHLNGSNLLGGTQMIVNTDQQQQQQQMNCGSIGTNMTNAQMIPSSTSTETHSNTTMTITNTEHCTVMANNGGNNNNLTNHNQIVLTTQQQSSYNQHHPLAQNDDCNGIDTNINHKSNMMNNNGNGNNNNPSNGNTNNENHIMNAPIVSSAPPLVLNLSQLQGSATRSLLILNGQHQQHHHHGQQVYAARPNDVQMQAQCKRNDHNVGHVVEMEQDVDKMDSTNISPSHNMKQSNTNTMGYENMIYSPTHQSTPITSPSKTNTNQSKDLAEPLPFFNETFDLSQEDIQKTLNANLPMSGDNSNSGNADNAMMGTEINTIDFFGGPSDVFDNLDAFEMLELDLDTKHDFFANNETNFLETDNCKDGIQLNTLLSRANRDDVNPEFSITDYSPEWAYPEGGVKVLVTGPWNLESNYTVLFDSFPVNTTIVQSGVLRCYCPAHEVGLVTLQVASDGCVISNSVIFEYKNPANVEGALNENFYKFNLYNRLESISEKFQIKTEPKDGSDEGGMFHQINFEEKLVNYCTYLSSRTWKPATPGNWEVGFRGMTLLHLAAALGFSKLVNKMLVWRSENPNMILDTEIDALRQDDQGFTPLMWACSRGFQDTAAMLYKWNRDAISVQNIYHQTAITIAKQKGFGDLALELEKLKMQDESRNNTVASGGLVSFAELRGKKPMYSYIGNSELGVGDSYQYLEKSGESDLQNNSENCESPVGSIASVQSHRSHDGVFLRPGAVTSPPAPRMSKRSSVDSGINVDIRSPNPNISRSGKISREHQKLLARFDRSMSLPISNSPQPYNPNEQMESYGLTPVDSSLELTSNSNSSSMLSPQRKMDFALCEVTTHESSQQANSDEESQPLDGQDRPLDGNGVVGDSDAKMFTLAEQIIAAIPDRIKIESDELMSLGSPASEVFSGDNSSIGVLSNENLIEPLSELSGQYDQEYSFNFNDQNYRLHDEGTPCSSLSPASSGPLQSPASYSFQQDPSMGSPSPPPTAQDFTEFFQASSSTSRPFESDFSKLTLTDREQRELYEAAKCIQKAYRSYKGRKKLEEQDKRSAATIIQNYYRRYKQYVYQRTQTHAAVVIQNRYRSYCETKRFKKSQTQPAIMSTNSQSQDSQSFQSYYKQYQSEQQQNQSLKDQAGGSSSKEASPSGPLKRTFSQRTQNQAARKIQQFMRQSKLKLQKERAEKERLVNQRRAEYLQSLQYRGLQEPQFTEANESVVHQNGDGDQQMNTNSETFWNR